ncbi:PVC-type heme-binding CxxCH protein [Marinimicrobium sp. ABcell2]|uniref:PVC-type heme-binding CxxCH protein n=1 Tax=Marinimicrobium sp. ABcell2 TaxID=3069751 RepID=UPI0027AF247F|nr:PVC-type heme-binding CxxCH protein [Marinimicrobium sp. ABcell2]MDQ2075148.1 c-type cytochrome [Marinimicrobium sp. ABcell2]
MVKARLLLINTLFGVSILGCSYSSINDDGQLSSDASETTPSETRNLGDREGHDMTPPIAAEDIPPAPVLMVPQAMQSMKIQPGFVLENVAAEPNVFNPVAMSFDGNGRMWVAEMTTFMPDLDGNNEEVPIGSIAILEDTNGDGVMDQRTVFLDDIILPRTIALVKGGILYSDQTQLYFAEVKAGDRLGIREVIDPDYARGGSVEHKPNGMLYALDNWYYNAKSDRRYKILPLDGELPQGSEEIYRNQYWKMALSKTESRGQWGLTMDDYGRLFHNWNSVPIQGEFLRPNSLNRNPDLVQEIKAHSIGSNRVYPVRMNPGVNRGYLPEILVSEGPDRGKLVSFTASSGSAIYRGDQFPDEFYGVAFTPEPAANLISARRIIEGQGEFSGEELYAQREILASTDERFRPVNLYTAPDGSLYILDMYHGVIQHKEFLTTYLREQSEARDLHKHNNNMGRIYRLRWADNELAEKPQLLTKTSSQLVPYLGHANGWHRDTARRLIVQRNDKSVADEITDLVNSSKDSRVQINALWTLEGLNAVNSKSIKAGLSSPHTKVQISAIELLTRLPENEQKTFASILMRLATSDYEVALQVALNAGDLMIDDKMELLEAVLREYGDKPLINEAVVSGISGREQELQDHLGSSASEKLNDLLALVGNQEIVESNFNYLVTQEQHQYLHGKSLYEGRAVCAGCHGQQGRGMDGMAPPLANSDRVTGEPDVLIKVILHGLRGPIKINGVEHEFPLVMPGLADNSSFSDYDSAAIATYIRNNWGNASGAISAKEVSKVREQTATRNQPYTADELGQ